MPGAGTGGGWTGIVGAVGVVAGVGVTVVGVGVEGVGVTVVAGSASGWWALASSSSWLTALAPRWSASPSILLVVGRERWASQLGRPATQAETQAACQCSITSLDEPVRW